MRGSDDGQHGNELWVSDGTPAGTHLVKDINPWPGLSSPLELLAEGDVLFFNALNRADETGAVTTQLWMTDGTWVERSSCGRRLGYLSAMVFGI